MQMDKNHRYPNSVGRCWLRCSREQRVEGPAAASDRERSICPELFRCVCNKRTHVINDEHILDTHEVFVCVPVEPFLDGSYLEGFIRAVLLVILYVLLGQYVLVLLVPFLL